MSTINACKKFPVVCPICKEIKDVEIPESIINQASQLTTVSIPKNLVCQHHFQIFVDKNFRVRGYQRVDFELKSENREDQLDFEKNVGDDNKRDEELLNNLILNGNNVTCRPKKTLEQDTTVRNNEKMPLKQKKMTLKEIYDEFWEFIDEDNEEFQDFIVKDNRRKKYLTSDRKLGVKENYLELKHENNLNYI